MASLESRLVPTAVPAGTCILFHGTLMHRGGANRSTRARRGVVHSDNLGWLRQAEPQYLAVPRQIAAQLPERLQRLVG